MHWFRYGRGGEGASAFFTDVDRNLSAENPDLGKLTRIGESHGLRFPLPPRALRLDGDNSLVQLFAATDFSGQPVRRPCVSLCRMSDDTCKSTIVSRVENLGEAAITSWDEQASIRALRVDNANNFCILDYFKSSVLTTIPRGWYCNRGSHRDVARRRVALAADRAGIDAASRETSAIEKLSET